MVAVKHTFKQNSYVSFCPLSLFNFVVSKSLAVFVASTLIPRSWFCSFFTGTLLFWLRFPR